MSKTTKIILIFLGILFIIAVIVGISFYVTQTQTQKNTHAALSTTLSFDPSSKTVGLNQSFDADIMIDPGNNQVSIVKLIVNYDGTKLATNSSGITPNVSVFSNVIEGPVFSCTGTTCIIAETLSVGNDPTKAVQSVKKVATLHFTSLAPTDPGTTNVIFNTQTNQTSVFSIGSSEQAQDNVLSTTTPLTLTITTSLIGTSGTPTPNTSPTPGVCQANVSTCSWNTATNAASYHFKINDLTNAAVVLEGDTTQTNVQFNSQPGITYQCNITASNACGASATAQGTATCPIPTPTPTTPTPTPTPTPISAPTPTPTPFCGGPCTADANCPTAHTCSNGTCVLTACLAAGANCSPNQCTQLAPTPTPTTPPPPQQVITPTPVPTTIVIVQNPNPTTVMTPLPKKPLPPTGPGDTFIKIGAAGLILSVIGTFIFFVL